MKSGQTTKEIIAAKPRINYLNYDIIAGRAKDSHCINKIIRHPMREISQSRIPIRRPPRPMKMMTRRKLTLFPEHCKIKRKDGIHQERQESMLKVTQAIAMMNDMIKEYK